MAFQRTISVINNRNKAERTRNKFREDEMQILNSQAVFKARLSDDLKDVDTILSDTNIKNVIVEVPDDRMAEFVRCIYTEDLADYVVQQYKDEPNKFTISKKIIVF